MQAMMLNDRIHSASRLQSTLAKADEYLSKLPPETPYSDFEHRFQEMGFDRGWGDNAEHVLETIHLLSDILQAPDPSVLETFLGRIPMVFNVYGGEPPPATTAAANTLSTTATTATTAANPLHDGICRFVGLSSASR
ncbi:sucrose synthase-like [Macadamia integrifolia]|uniref:sucrose synthase-like n=1 Tax=Macadamia integrifolia TaxID=60698 RepID=UPI001C52AAD4|nr:sucrose synthase-like [Macadamia integrifolia]